MKKLYSAFLALVLLISFQSVSGVSAAPNAGTSYLKDVRILDNNGVEYPEGAVIGPNETFYLEYDWNIPSYHNLKKDDVISFDIPEQLRFYSNLSFKIVDNNGNEIGEVTLDSTTKKVSIKFTELVEDPSGMTGQLKFAVLWDKKIVNSKDKVPLEFNLDGKTKKIVGEVGEESEEDKDEILAKIGWVDSKDPSKIHWRIRVNKKQEVIENMELVDTIASGHELIEDSLVVEYGTFKINDDNSAFNFTATGVFPKSNINIYKNGFDFKIDRLDQSMYVQYSTQIIDEADGQEKFYNKVKMTGSNIKDVEKETYESSEGGSGTGNNKSANLMIEKVDSVTQDKLKDAVFTIKDENGKVVYDNLRTNSDGIIMVNKIRIGTYHLVEREAPAGYELLKNPVVIEITDEFIDKVFSIQVKNSKEVEPTGRLEIIKVDNESQRPLSGAEFELYDSNNMLIKSNLISDEDGIIIVEKLKLGQYYLKEVKAPSGYILDNTLINFEITQDTTLVELTIKNSKMVIPTGRLELVKIDKANKERLSGAVFALFDESNELIAENLATDENGVLSVETLALGNYYLKEIVAPQGYVLDQEEIHFTVTLDNLLITLTVENTKEEIVIPTGSVEIIKVDSETKDKLEGAEFALYSESGELLKKNLKTNSEGKVLIEDLPYGTYTIIETKAPKGYKLDKTPHKFTLNDQTPDKRVSITIENKKNILPPTGISSSSKSVGVGLVVLGTLMIVKKKED